MHKFNLEIEIPDRDYCNGCPCLNERMGTCSRYHSIIQYSQKENKDIRLDICKQNDNKPEVEDDWMTKQGTHLDIGQ